MHYKFILLTLALLSSTGDLPDLRRLETLSRSERGRFLGYESTLRRIHYVRNGHASQVFPLGDEVRRILHGTIPSLSPDGRFIALVRADRISTDKTWISVLDLQSNSFRDLFPWPSQEFIYGLAWSPSGKEIAFIAKYLAENNRGKTGLFITDLTSPQAHRVITIGRSLCTPSRSPDGKEIAYDEFYSIDPFGSARTIFIFHRESEGVRLLDLGESPSWSPQGDRIAYIDRNRCYTIKPDGSGKTLLFKGKNSIFDLQRLISAVAWSPNGQSLVYHKSDGDKGYDRRLYYFDIRTKKRKEVFSGSRVQVLNWQPAQ